jgi:hypothetical protein
MILRAAIHSTVAIAAGCLCSCGCHDKSEQVTLRKGGLLSTHHNGKYRLDRVDDDSITISHLGGVDRQGWELSSHGEWGGGEPHSLGNNESLEILRTDPISGSATVGLTWRDWCGPFSIPAF